MVRKAVGEVLGAADPVYAAAFVVEENGTKRTVYVFSPEAEFTRMVYVYSPLEKDGRWLGSVVRE